MLTELDRYFPDIAGEEVAGDNGEQRRMTKAEKNDGRGSDASDGQCRVASESGR